MKHPLKLYFYQGERAMVLTKERSNTFTHNTILVNTEMYSLCELKVSRFITSLTHVGVIISILNIVLNWIFSSPLKFFKGSSHDYLILGCSVSN